jgi:signal transduction histidine kinase
MIRDVTEQQRSQQQLSTNRQQLRSLAVELSSAEERERRRIATGIHDNVSQRLAMTKLLLGSIRENASAEQKDPLREAVALLDHAIEESRSLTFELSPPVLYELGLTSALEWLAEKIQRRHGLQIRIKNRLGSVIVPIDLRVLLFQAARELLANSVKHSAAHRATVTIGLSRSKHPQMVQLIIQDDGRGFETKELTPDRAGFGLFNLRTRFEQIGGSFQLLSAAGRGTRVTMIAPFDAGVLVTSADSVKRKESEAGHVHENSNRRRSSNHPAGTEKSARPISRLPGGRRSR